MILTMVSPWKFLMGLPRSPWRHKSHSVKEACFVHVNKDLIKNEKKLNFILLAFWENSLKDRLEIPESKGKFSEGRRRWERSKVSWTGEVEVGSRISNNTTEKYSRATFGVEKGDWDLNRAAKEPSKG